MGFNKLLNEHFTVVKLNLIADLHTKKISEGDLGLKFTIDGDKGGTMVANNYWYYLVYGRKPGKQPPTESILGWLVRKGIMPEGKITLKSLAYLIARKIGRVGTDIFLGKRPGLALDEITKARSAEFKKHLSDEYVRIIKEEINKKFSIQ